MKCPTKNMTSYQRLKWELDETYKALAKEREKSLVYKNALWRITKLDPEEEKTIEVQKIALGALIDTINK